MLVFGVCFLRLVDVKILMVRACCDNVGEILRALGWEIFDGLNLL
jgi:hypothetical protein